ncbi:hypothetical protein [Rhizobium sp. RCC_161_2]|uniref:hypothetical protein n=1 Tax=Rhizobium sp. RCC_161_2 TaxID=3239219 RepID=UPI0035235335
MHREPPQQVELEKKRKHRRAAERWQRHLAELHRRREQADRDRKRRLRWLIMLWLMVLESIPTATFSPVILADEDARQQKRQPPRPRKSRKKDELDKRDDPRSEDDRRYMSDYSPRYGEESQEVYDGLTWSDIIAHNKVHRPWLFPVFKPLPGTPQRYIDEQLHIWTLLDHLKHDFLRKDAISALKLIVASDAHPWVDACAALPNGWKQLRYCRGRTPDMTIAAFPRMAALWREEQRREAEERAKELKETPDSGPKSPGIG